MSKRSDGIKVNPLEVIVVDAATLCEINEMISRDKAVEDAGECEVIKTFTAIFEDGYEADLKICNGDSGAYVDPVLFDENGHEVATLEPVFDQFTGVYVWDLDGRRYRVAVRPKAIHLLFTSMMKSSVKLVSFETDVHRSSHEERTYARVKARITFAPDQFLVQLIKAVTQWVAKTGQGQGAWTYSSEDFNIGDLSGESFDPDTALGEILAEHGIFQLSVNTFCSDQACQGWEYDTVLVDRQGLTCTNDA